jgi:hypothetical protein
MATFTTHYDNLKVARNAPLPVIRAAYKALSQQYHPDRNQSPDAPRIMRIINQAYHVLSDPELRAEHDAWISRQTDSAPEEPHFRDAGQSTEPGPRPSHQQRSAHRRPLVIPQGGAARADRLPQALLNILKDRVRDKSGDQERIALSRDLQGFMWRALIPVGLLVFTAFSAFGTRWHRDSAVMLAWTCLPFGMYLGAQAYGLFNWFTKHFRPSLIASPIYLIETSWDRVAYWPITDVRITEATRHTRNGSFTHTSFTLHTAGMASERSTDSDHGYTRFTNKLVEGFGWYETAQNRSDQQMLDARDELKGTTLPEVAAPLKKSPIRFAWWIGGAVAFFLAVGLLAQINKSMPKAPPARGSQYSQSPPANSPSPARPYTAPVEAPQPVQVDRIVERLGAGNVPSRAQYIKGEPYTHTDGQSTVTVDNTQGSDVLAKLVRVEGANAWPVRVFYIPGGSSFTAENITPGNYEVRYITRYADSASKSEEFAITEDSTQYSVYSLTLYTVQGGNMRMQTIPADQF